MNSEKPVQYARLAIVAVRVIASLFVGAVACNALLVFTPLSSSIQAPISQLGSALERMDISAIEQATVLVGKAVLPLLVSCSLVAYCVGVSLESWLSRFGSRRRLQKGEVI